MAQPQERPKGLCTNTKAGRKEKTSSNGGGKRSGLPRTGRKQGRTGENKEPASPGRVKKISKSERITPAH